MPNSLPTSGQPGITPPPVATGQTPSPMTPPPPSPSSKKWLWIMIIIIVIAALAAGGYFGWEYFKNEPTEKSSASDKGWITYTDEDLSFSFQYPDSWNSFDNYAYIGVKGNNNQTSSCFSVGPESNTDSVVPSAKEAFETSKKEAEESGHPYNIIEEGETTLDGRPAYYAYYKTETTKLESYPVYKKAIWAIDIKEKYEEKTLYDTYKLVYREGDLETDFEREDLSCIGSSLPADEWEGEETYNEIISSFKFSEESKSLNQTTASSGSNSPKVLGCLAEFPTENGNTWTYNVNGDELGQAVSYQQTNEIIETAGHEYTVEIKTTGNDSESIIKETYGVDEAKNNLYLNFREIDLGEALSHAGGGGDFVNYKIFSCQDDSWEIDVDLPLVEADFGTDTPFGQEFDFSMKLIGDVRIIERDTQIDVPAGTFTADLVELNLREEPTTSIAGDLTIPITQRLWLVPDVGIVKMENVTGNLADIALELESYSI